MRHAGAHPSPPWIEPAWDVLEIITSGSADGISIQDSTGRLIYANDAAARMNGFESGREMQEASAERIVQGFEILDEDGLPFAVDELPGRRALRGEQEPEAVIRFRRRLGGEDRWALVRATPLFDDDGSVRHVVNVFVDITADRAQRQAQAFLAEATMELASSLDWEATLQRVAQLAVPTMADWCALDVLQPDGSLSLIAVAHVDPAKVQWAYELRRRFPTDEASDLARAVRTRKSKLIPEITQGWIDTANITDADLMEFLEGLQLSSIMFIPLVARRRAIGVLTMAWAEAGKHYSEDDRHLAEDLASRAAFAIDNARLYRERDHIARSLQERLLPKSLPEVPGLDVAARYVPAGDVLQAGGDFYDLFEMEDGSWKAVIGDVCGKGPEAAALMGFVRFTTRAVSRQDTKPSEALVKLNKALREELYEGSGEFCTAAVVRIRQHQDGARLTIAVAGHPLPLIVRSNGQVQEVGAPGTLLGVFDEIEVSDVVADLHYGDSLVMITDGVWEAGRDDEWELRVIPALLSTSARMSPNAIADRIEEAVAGINDRRTDDIAILLISPS